jgi:hypothetical protein
MGKSRENPTSFKIPRKSEQEMDELRSILSSSSKVNLKTVETKTHELFQLLLIERDHQQQPFRDLEISSATKLIQDVCLRFPDLTSIYLSYLQILPEDMIGPFIDIIPSIFSMSSDYQIEEAFKASVTLIESDNRNTLRVLSALIDLPLLPHLQAQLSSLAIDSLASVEESDVPSLCRTILKNLSTVDALPITQEIRTQVIVSSYFDSPLTSLHH